MAPLRRTLLALLALAPWAVVPTASFVRPPRGPKAPLRSIRGGGGDRLSTAMAAAGGADEAMMERLRSILLKGQATGGAAPAPAAAPSPSDGAWDIELCSPSKVNLFLRITARRDDGYHDLASLFQVITPDDLLAAATERFFNSKHSCRRRRCRRCSLAILSGDSLPPTLPPP